MTTIPPATLLSPLAAAAPATEAFAPPFAQSFEVFSGGSRGDTSFLLEADPGQRIALGRRDGHLITAELKERRRGVPKDVYYDVAKPRKAHEIVLNVEENGAAGLLHFFLTPEETFLFEVDTRNQNPRRGPPMQKGAGTILLTWLATQAALRGVLFAVTGIQNFKVADIVFKRRLIETKTGRVEYCNSFQEGRYACTKRFSLDDETALYRYQSFRLDYPRRFLVISGRPHPRLVRDVHPSPLGRSRA